ncbi:class I SAM-dependent methyltransferase [Salinactinospora qingdaonensis]|uniref:Class I SAM-dependent methyltransferase n=1 Tax=Salinactinospora qingdaonensis TaxID=702744 RepID=A0ABP7FYY7_9ACTN
MSSLLSTAPVKRLFAPALRRLEARGRITAKDTAKSPTTTGSGHDSGVHAEVAELRKQVEALRYELHYTELLFGDLGGRGNRRPTSKQIAHLEKEIRAVTGVESPHAAVVQAYRSIVEVELRGVGRIAGGTMNVLGKLVTTPLLAPPNGQVLEIGTLFGLFSCCMARQMTRYGVDYRLSIVDPLVDVQIQPGRPNGSDRSGSPVSEPVLRANLALGGVPEERVRIRRGYSTDPAARAELSDREYGVVIIDGDHTEEGVRADLEWAEKLVAPGAIVVLDDYGDTKWPGVTKAAEGHLQDSDRFEFLGSVATSAFLRAT